MINRTVSFLILLALAPFCSATVMKWSFEDANFIQPSSIEGTFNFDTNSVQNDPLMGVDLLVSGGTLGIFVDGVFTPQEAVADAHYDAGSYLGRFDIASLGGLVDLFDFFNSDALGSGVDSFLRVFVRAPNLTAGDEVAPLVLFRQARCGLPQLTCPIDTNSTPFRSGTEGSLVRVPEPTTLSLLCAGLVGLAWRSRRTT